VSVTVRELESVQVLQRASAVLRGHLGDLLQDAVQLLVTGALREEPGQRDSSGVCAS